MKGIYSPMPHLPLGNRRYPHRGFTLIELLVVIAIIAILAVVVVLTLNPAQLLAQSRDANRVSDMATLNSAINLYQTDQSGSSGYSLGNSTTSYLSLPSLVSNCSSLGMATSAYAYACSTSANYRNASSSGWLPINFQNISSGAPFGSLPVDPVNQSSSNLYYAYETNGNQYVLSSFMESQKYAKNMATTGGVDPVLYEIGPGANILPDATRGLVGYWPMNEGQGTIVNDWSGNGILGNFASNPSWVSPGHGNNSAALQSSASTGNINWGIPPIHASSAITIALWEYTNTSAWPGGGNYIRYFDNNWASAPGTWIVMAAPSGGLIWGIINSSNGQVVAGCSATSLALQSWQFITVTYNGSTMNAYVNGSLCGTQTFANQTLSTSGGFDNNTAANVPVMENEIRVYDRVLSAAEIQEIYNAEK